MSQQETQRRVVGRHTIITMEDQSLPVVRFVVASGQGALTDPEGMSGLTYLTWELMLRGTQGKTRGEFTQQLEGLGSSLTASVGDETASVRGLCLQRQLGETLDLMSEAMLQPAYDKRELDDLRGELIDDLASVADDDASLCAVFWRRAIFEGTLRSRIPGGEIEDLDRMTSVALVEAHQEKILEGPLVWVFAGAISPEQAEENVLARWPALEDSVLTSATLPEINAPRRGRIMVVDKPGRTQVQLRVGQLIMGGNDGEAEAFWLGSTAFGGTFTSPLNREVRDKRGWSYFASSEFRRTRRTVSAMILHSAPSVEDLPDCLGLELELLGGLASGELDVEEIKRAREYMLNRYPLSVATASDRIVPTLLLELLGREPAELMGLPARLEAMEPARVAEVMQERLCTDELLVVMVASADEVVPALKKRFGHLAIDVVDYRSGLERVNAPASA